MDLAPILAAKRGPGAVVAGGGPTTMNMRGRLSGLAALAALAIAAPAAAHHSGAMFDHNKTVTLEGTIKEFRWLNPHASIEVLVANPAGGMDDWSIECSTPNILVRKGWGLHSLNPGDKVSLTMHPMKDGGHAGFIMAVTTPSGAQLKDHDY
jgi:hypothetical protein